MLRVLAVGRLVLLQGLGAAVVEEVDLDARLAAAVGAGHIAGEVGQEVDVLAVDLAGGEDAGDLDADIGLGVYKMLASCSLSNTIYICV